MKNKLLLLLSAFTLLPLSSCSSPITSLNFEFSEYVIKSGEKVTVNENSSDIRYRVVKANTSDFSLDEYTGTFTFSDSLTNYTQVLYEAYINDLHSNLVVVTLTHEYKDSPINIVNPNNKVVDGESIIATNEHNYAMTYSLVGESDGISIDSSSGVVTFASSVIDGQEFTVRVKTKSTEVSKIFYAATEKLVTVNNIQSAEVNGSDQVVYELDFSRTTLDVPEQNVLSIYSGKNIANSDEFSYDKANNELTIEPSFLNRINPGENIINIVTSRNTVQANLIMATKYIRTPSDLQSINESEDALKGYYVLLNDIDLTEYLSSEGEGYNDGKGWIPVGRYQDVIDGTALKYAFNGTFDGNGHTISGYYINRRDELGFNAGLFGYITNLSVIKNVALVGSNEQSITASYSGGLVGVNNGLVINCSSNVDISNAGDGETYNMIGGLVGRNMGEINSCISTSKVDGDMNMGVLSGYNEGTIVNSYGLNDSHNLIGGGIAAINSNLFDTLEEMKSFNYDSFDQTYWSHKENELPTLNNYIKSYVVNNLLITNKVDYLIRGNAYKVNTIIYPSELYEEYKSQIQYEIIGEGYTIDANGNVTTKNATSKDFEVKVTLQARGKTYTDSFTGHLYEKPTKVELINTMEGKVNIGCTYKLQAKVTPEDAFNEFTYKIVSGGNSDIRIEDDLLIISELAQPKNIYIRASAAGVNSSNLKLSVVNPITFNESDCVTLYKNEDVDASFTLPSEHDYSNVEVIVGDNTLDTSKYSVNENVVTIDKTIFKTNSYYTLPVLFRLSDEVRIRSYGTYINKERVNYEELLNDPEVIKISSLSDFETYFNVVGYDEAKTQYLSKTFVLTNDIDFENKEITSIGGIKDAFFTGKIYGNGHEIKNAVINDNEIYHTLTSEQKSDKYRTSKYNVGFFTSFDGEMYDVVFNNIKVSANNYVGTLAGTLLENSYIEHVTFKNCLAIDIDESPYSDPAQNLKVGGICAANTGSENIVATLYNNSIYNMVG